MKRTAQAIWEGSGLEGQGHLTTKSKAIEALPYSFKSRFKNKKGTSGTNPEELIAAAHAGCFNMALSFQLSNAGYAPTLLETEAVLTMKKVDGNFTIVEIKLDLKGNVPNISAKEFKKLAVKAKENCPVSKALAAVPILLSSKLFKP